MQHFILFLSWAVLGSTLLPAQDHQSSPPSKVSGRSKTADFACTAMAATIAKRCDRSQKDETKELDNYVKLLEGCTQDTEVTGGLFVAAQWERRRKAGALPVPDEGQRLRRAVQDLRLQVIAAGREKVSPEAGRELAEMGRTFADPQLKFVARAFADRLDGKPWPDHTRLMQALQFLPVYETHPIHPLQNLCASLPKKPHPVHGLDPRYAIWELGIWLALDDPQWPAQRDGFGADQPQTFFPLVASELGRILAGRDASGLRSVPLSTLLNGWVMRNLPGSDNADLREAEQKAVSDLSKVLVSHLVPQTAALFPVRDAGRNVIVPRRAPQDSQFDVILPHHSLGAEEYRLNWDPDDLSSDGLVSPILFGTARRARFRLPSEKRLPFEQDVKIKVRAEEFISEYKLRVQRSDRGSQLVKTTLVESKGPRFQDFDQDGLRKGMVVVNINSMPQLRSQLEAKGFRCEDKSHIDSLPEIYHRSLTDPKERLDYLTVQTPSLLGSLSSSGISQHLCTRAGGPRQAVWVVGCVAPRAFGIRSYFEQKGQEASGFDNLVRSTKQRPPGAPLLLTIGQGEPGDYREEQARAALDSVFSRIGEDSELLPLSREGIREHGDGIRRIQGALDLLIDGGNFAQAKQKTGHDLRDLEWAKHSMDPGRFKTGEVESRSIQERGLGREISRLKRWPMNLRIDDSEAERVWKDLNTRSDVPTEFKDLVVDPSRAARRRDVYNRQSLVRMFAEPARYDWLRSAYTDRALEDLSPQGLFVQQYNGPASARRDAGVVGAVGDMAMAHTPSSVVNDAPAWTNEEMRAEVLEAYIAGKSPPASWLDPEGKEKARKIFVRHLTTGNASQRKRSIDQLAAAYPIDRSTVETMARLLREDAASVKDLLGALDRRAPNFEHAEVLDPILTEISRSPDLALAKAARKSRAILGLGQDQVPSVVRAFAETKDDPDAKALLTKWAAHGDVRALSALKDSKASIAAAYHAYRAAGRTKQRVVFEDLLELSDIWNEDLNHLAAEAPERLIRKFPTRRKEGLSAMTGMARLKEFHKLPSPAAYQQLREYATDATEEPMRTAALLTLAELDRSDREVRKKLSDQPTSSEEGRFAQAIVELSDASVSNSKALERFRTVAQSIKETLPLGAKDLPVSLLTQANPAVQDRVVEFFMSRVKNPGDKWCVWLSQMGKSAHRGLRARSLVEKSTSLRLGLGSAFKLMPRDEDWERTFRVLMQGVSATEFSELVQFR